MSPSLLIACAVAYIWVAVQYGRQRDWGMMAAFISYAVANIGFAYKAWRG